MNNFPELEPLQLRPEAQPGYQKIAWKPTWNCFCCHDTGLVIERLIKQIMPRYVHGRHKLVECNATNCKIQLGELLYTTQTLDERFTPSICDRLDKQERQMWHEWSKDKHEMRKKRNAIADEIELTKNLRARSRISCEQLEVERRHQNIRNDY